MDTQSHSCGGSVNLFRKNSITVATIEKANALVCHYGARRGALRDLAVVVVDELHMIHDADRGGGLECLLTKLLHMYARVCRIAPELRACTCLSARVIGAKHVLYGARHNYKYRYALANACVHVNPPPRPLRRRYPRVQIVGMSATMPRLRVVADWLGAHACVRARAGVHRHMHIPCGPAAMRPRKPLCAT